MQATIKKEVESFAREIRIMQLEMFANLGFGHIGGSLSISDLLATLYGSIMKFDPKNPKWSERDRLVVSKGHSGPAVYATLTCLGFFPKEMLLTLNQGGTMLPSHCDMNRTPGIDMTTGSLGQGASTACGIALALKDDREKTVFLILGDGECQEGQVWEAAMFAAGRKLDNLVAFVDRNGKQLDGYTESIMPLGSLEHKFEAFGWNVQTVDGHNVEQLYDSIMAAKTLRNGHPSVIIMDTIKGKGAAFVEETMSNHHMTVSKEQAEAAIQELLR